MIPLINGVDQTPPTAPKPLQTSLAPPAPAPQQEGMAASSPPNAPTALVFASSPSAPTECLPQGLRAVLQDVQGRFGPVTLVSTTELHTDNHTKGSVRHKLHADCKAVDFKVEGDLAAVTAFLRARPEVGGVNTYKNNRVIHIDAAEPRTFAQR